MDTNKYDICVIGGAGHVGLPFSLVFANKGFKVVILDINKETMGKIAKGLMPFKEEGGENLLKKNINKNLFLSENPEVISQSKFVVTVIGTPIDEHLNPEFTLMKKTFEKYLPYFHNGQIVILRSTIYPGITEKIQEFFKEKKLDVKISFCPERVVEGIAIEEFQSQPQIISAFDRETAEEVGKLFKKACKEVLFLMPMEAELAKLFTNAWRYIHFAIANQFYMLAKNKGVDFYRIHKAITHNYPRAKDFPKAGFSAGPCLLKDTMQLAAFNENRFDLGTAAMLINEGVPNFLVEQLKKGCILKEKTVGILGMAFKANSDDKRESLAYKLKKILEIEAKQVFCSDVYIKDEDFISKEELIKKSNIIILGATHKEYEDLEIPKEKTLIDIWNFYEDKYSK